MIKHIIFIFFIKFIYNCMIISIFQIQNNIIIKLTFIILTKVNNLLQS